MRHPVLAIAAYIALTLPASAGPIERACLKGDRAGTRALCGCIQDAADLVLSHGDQKRAAQFFRDPHQAQVVRQSDRRRDSEFWKRYVSFGETAERYCASS